MTSNIGSHLIQEKISGLNEDNLDEIMGDLRVGLTNLLHNTIRPEFLNRIDEIVLFKPLLKNEINKIIDIQLNGLYQLLHEKNIKIEFTENAKDFLLEKGFDATYGARPMKRAIQKCVLNRLSTELLLNNFESGDTILVDYKGNHKLEFTKL